MVDVESYKKHLRKIDMRSSVTITTKILSTTARKVGQKRGWKAITSLTKRHMVVVRYSKNAVVKKKRRIRLDVVQWNSVQKNVNLNRTILSHYQSYLQIQDNLYYNRRIKCLEIRMIFEVIFIGCLFKPGFEITTENVRDFHDRIFVVHDFFS